MNNQTASDTANAAKNLAAQIAKQMAREPAEFLDDIKEQTTGERSPPQPQNPLKPPEGNKFDHEKHEEADKLKSTRLIEALNRELSDIQKHKLFKELQARIAAGEQIPLHEYPELSMEQKQVLNAQMEAVKVQRMAAAQTTVSVPSVHSKPSRRFGAGQKDQAQKEQTRVEKPLPTSG